MEQLDLNSSAKWDSIAIEERLSAILVAGPFTAVHCAWRAQHISHAGDCGCNSEPLGSFQQTPQLHCQLACIAHKIWIACLALSSSWCPSGVSFCKHFIWAIQLPRCLSKLRASFSQCCLMWSQECSNKEQAHCTMMSKSVGSGRDMYWGIEEWGWLLSTALHRQLTLWADVAL